MSRSICVRAYERRAAKLYRLCQRLLNAREKVNDPILERAIERTTKRLENLEILLGWHEGTTVKWWVQ